MSENEPAPPLDVAAIDALCDAATAGPWERFTGRVRRNAGRALDQTLDVHNAAGVVVVGWSGFDSADGNYLQRGRDARFIAAARSLVPQLVARVRELEGELQGRNADLGFGNCPVQIDRTAHNRRFYFRARHECFSLSVGADGDMNEFAAVDGETVVAGEICDAFAAGWMPHPLAAALTEWGIKCWEHSQKDSAKEVADFMNALKSDVDTTARECPHCGQPTRPDDAHTCSPQGRAEEG